jgi:DNA mismatch repair protein MutS
MNVDHRTLMDLEVIAGPLGSPTLIDVLDRSSTRGGRNAFAARITAPLGSLDEIREVQAALRFLIEHEGAIRDLPGEDEVAAMARYLESNLAPLRRLRGPLAWWEALVIRLRYPEVGEAALDGGILFRLFMTRLEKVQEGLRGGPPLLERLAGRLEEHLSARPLQEALRWDEGRWTGLQALRADRLIREEGRRAVRELIELVYEIDGLASMARATGELGFAFPDFETDEVGLRIEGLRHPFLDDPVENPLILGEDERVLFLTGPNMAGKTTYLKAGGVAVLLAHCGMGVPAAAARLGPFSRLVVAIRTEDSLRDGVSYFQAEARRVRGILDAVTTEGRCLVIVDELFRGTNVQDAREATAAVLRGFALARGSFFLVASHLPEVAEELGDRGLVLRRFEVQDGGGRFEFTYRLSVGLSNQRLGMEVLRREGVLEALERLAPGREQGPPSHTEPS